MSHWTPEQYENYMRRKRAAAHRTAIPPAHMEQGPGNAPASAHEVEAIDAPVVLHIHSVRHRLADSDGLCAKWVIDSLVAEGILHDDSAKHVKEVRFTQCEGNPEKTIIEIRSAKNTFVE